MRNPEILEIICANNLPLESYPVKFHSSRMLFPIILHKSLEKPLIKWRSLGDVYWKQVATIYYAYCMFENYRPKQRRWLVRSCWKKLYIISFLTISSEIKTSVLFFFNSSRVSLLTVVNSEMLSKSERNLCIKKIFCFQLFLMLSKIIFDSLLLHMDARLFFLRGPNMCS